jgi:hypothetical protein
MESGKRRKPSWILLVILALALIVWFGINFLSVKA